MQQVCLVSPARFTSTHFTSFASASGYSLSNCLYYSFRVLSILEPVSSLLHPSSIHRRSLPLASITSPTFSAAATVCSCHISDLRDLTSRSHAVATILQPPFRTTSHRRPGARQHNSNTLSLWLRLRYHITQHPTKL